ERLQSGFHDQIDVAGRQQTVRIAVAAVTAGTDPGLDPRETAALLARGKQIRMGRGHHRIVGPPDGARADAAPAVIGSAEPRAATNSPEAFASVGLVHDAQHRHASASKANQGPPDRKTEHERPGPIDRVDDPAPFRLEYLG